MTTQVVAKREVAVPKVAPRDHAMHMKDAGAKARCPEVAPLRQLRFVFRNVFVPCRFERRNPTLGLDQGRDTDHDVDDGLSPKVLAFYAPDKRGASGSIPRLTLDQVTTRVFGETALAIGRVSFTPPGASQPAGRMRAVFALRAVGGRWLLVSSQYTPIRENRG